MKKASNTSIGERILAAAHRRPPSRRYQTAAELGECMRRRDDPNP